MEEVRKKLAKYRSGNPKRLPSTAEQDRSQPIYEATEETRPEDSVSTRPVRGNTTIDTTKPTASSGPGDYLTPYQNLVLKCLLWLGLFGGFIYCGIGTVYLLLSAFYLVYKSMHHYRRSGEISAYSVFNKNCQSIDGTLTADQFDKEIRFRT